MTLQRVTPRVRTGLASHGTAHSAVTKSPYRADVLLYHLRWVAMHLWSLTTRNSLVPTCLIFYVVLPEEGGTATRSSMQETSIESESQGQTDSPR